MRLKCLSILLKHTLGTPFAAEPLYTRESLPGSISIRAQVASITPPINTMAVPTKMMNVAEKLVDRNVATLYWSINAC